MVEHADGRRLLLVDTPDLGRFVADTYAFDAVRVTPVTVRREGFVWTVTAPPLELRFTVGGRGALGWLLHAGPAPDHRRDGLLGRRGPRPPHRRGPAGAVRVRLYAADASSGAGDDDGRASRP
ncbi:hypothetical protein GCM10009557_34930 [Virgisporangium ochraceum]|uniref:Uncharacterized protein n=1 Tax=Virgisporangium ochraceum TaxID=65505 RepID=A0A8J3ZX99_9ACTN|nr:hypothetical protein Voc01_057950 [Virgisporangium ochraceum]